MRKPGRKIDAALKTKIALEAVREQASVADIAARHGVHPNQIYAWKKQLLENAVRAFDAGVGLDADEVREREAACQDRAVDGGARFLAKRSGR